MWPLMAQKKDGGASSAYEPAGLTAAGTVGVCLRADGKRVNGAWPIRKVPMLGRPASDDADDDELDELTVTDDVAEGA